MKQIHHKGVYGVLQREGYILLVNKTRGPYMGLRDLPGGRMEHGETDEQALVREIHDETGIDILKWRIFDVLHHRFEYSRGGDLCDFLHEGTIYVIEKFDDSGFDRCLASEDVSGCAWLSVGESQDLSPFAEAICDRLRINPNLI